MLEGCGGSSGWYLSEIVNQKFNLLMWNTFSRSTLIRSEDMSDDQKGHYMDYLSACVTNLDLDKRAIFVLKDFLKIQQEMR